MSLDKRLKSLRPRALAMRNGRLAGGVIRRIKV